MKKNNNLLQCFQPLDLEENGCARWCWHNLQTSYLYTYRGMWIVNRDQEKTRSGRRYLCWLSRRKWSFPTYNPQVSITHHLISQIGFLIKMMPTWLSAMFLGWKTRNYANYFISEVEDTLQLHCLWEWNEQVY